MTDNRQWSVWYTQAQRNVFVCRRTEHENELETCDVTPTHVAITRVPAVPFPEHVVSGQYFKQKLDIPHRIPRTLA